MDDDDDEESAFQAQSSWKSTTKKVHENKNMLSFSFLPAFRKPSITLGTRTGESNTSETASGQKTSQKTEKKTECL